MSALRPASGQPPPVPVNVLGDSPFRSIFQAPRTEVLVLVGALYNLDLLQVSLAGPLPTDVTGHRPRPCARPTRWHEGGIAAAGPDRPCLALNGLLDQQTLHPYQLARARRPAPAQVTVGMGAPQPTSIPARWASVAVFSRYKDRRSRYCAFRFDKISQSKR